MDFDLFGCWFVSSNEILRCDFIDGTKTGHPFKWMIKLPFITITKIW